MQNSACSSLITNCRFVGNSGNCALANAGLGAFAPRNEAGPTFIDCIFSANSGVNAGGVSSSGCIVSFQNCDFINNTSSVYGGGMSGNQAVINLSNCRFSVHLSSQEGGGLYMDKCISNITGCSFSRNISDFGGGISNISDTSIR